MWRECVLCALCVVAAGTALAARLTEAETRWLRAGLPVLQDARQRALPVDVIVQPQAAPGDAALAMDFIDGRCKLVVSMRGNPQAEAILAAAPPALAGRAIEAVFAHEVAHCWRHVHGRWKVLPAGFAEAAGERRDARAQARRDMRATRREEGYADLAALAWTLRRHPEDYPAVHAWLTATRAHPAVPGSHHDTRAWVRLATDPVVFPPAGGPYEQAHVPWERGLLLPD